MEQKAPAKRNRLLIGGVLLLLLASLALLLLLLGGEGTGKKNHALPILDYPYLYDENEGSVNIVTKEKSFSLDGFFPELYPSLDGKSGFVTVQVFEGIPAITKTKLYDLSGKLIAENILHYDVTVSPGGTSVIYTTFDGTTRAPDKVMLYDGEGNHVLGDASEGLSGFVFSPSGKALAYAVIKEEALTDAILFKDGKKTSLGKDFLPLGMTEGGEILYGNVGDCLCIIKDGTRRLYDGELYGDRAPIFNADSTEGVFHTSKATYFMKNGEPMVFLSGEGALTEWFIPGSPHSVTDNKTGSTVIAARTLLGAFYRREDGIYSLSEKGETQLIASTSGEGALLPDGRTLIYRINGDVYQTDGHSLRPRTVLKGRVKTLIGACKEGFFFKDTDGALCFSTLRGKETVIDSNSAQASLYQNNYLFYIKSGMLYTAKAKALTPTPLLPCLNDGDIYLLPGYAAFLVTNDGIRTHYITRDGETVQKVGEIDYAKR